jgi:hypothetical protein
MGLTSSAEIERLKANADLVSYACRRRNYAVDPQESSPRGNPTHWVLKRPDGRKVLALQTQDCWLYYDLKLYGEVLGSRTPIRGEGHGTIIDFIQEELGLPKGPGTPGFGLALRELRDFVGAAPVPSDFARTNSAASPPPGPRAATPEVLQAWQAAQSPKTSRYLTSRGLTAATLNSERFIGTWRVDRRQNVLFPHRDAAGTLTGFDIKNYGISIFSKGGVKTGVWRSNPNPLPTEDPYYLLTEASINNLSFQQLHPQMAIEHRAFGGRIGKEQLRVVATELKSLSRTTTVLLGFDGNGDLAGREYERQIREVLPAWLRAERTHPPRGKDWNEYLQSREIDR